MKRRRVAAPASTRRAAAGSDAVVHARLARPRRASGTPADRRRLYAWAALILVSGFLAYANSLNNPYVIDDQRALIENTTIRTLTPISVPLSPPEETPVARRPLVNLSFAIDYAVAGLDVGQFRLTNLAIHLAAALVLFGLTRRTLLLDSLAQRFGRHATTLAGVSALLWALHPLQTEVVNYISQRTTSLKGLCYLLTMYCAVRGLAAPAARWTTGAIAACAAGMACKESMVTAPVVVLLFDRAFVFGSFGRALRMRPHLYAGLASTWVVLGALMASGGRTTVGFEAGTSAWSYLLNQAPVVLDYIRLALWPRALVVDYGMPQPVALGDVLLPLLVIGVLGAAALAALWYRPHAGFLAASAFVTLAPTSSIVPIVTEVGAERRMYLALAALVVLAVCGAYRAGASTLARMADGGHSVPARVPFGIAAAAVTAIAALLATGTIVRNREYQSPLSLARTVVERRPHGRAYYTLGNALFQAGQRSQAIEYFRQSADDFPAAHFALGSELLMDGSLAAGIGELRTFTELMPLHPAVPAARQMMATALAAQGDIDSAVAELQEALAAEPEAARAQALLGELLVARGDAAAAVPHLERAAAAQPRDPATLRTLARALAMTGDTARTLDVLERGVALHPRDASLRDLLGTALARRGRVRDALDHFRAAAALDPEYERARQNIAAAERQLGAR